MRPTRWSRSSVRSTLRLAGPALGGVLVGVLGLGAAFLADAATFMVSAATLWSMSSRPPRALRRAALRWTPRGRQLRDGWSYVRRHVWLWGTFASAGIAYLLFMGPAEVLLPFMVKHELGGSGVQLGLVLGAGGLGSVACALAMARSGLPSRSITFIYVVWTLATVAVAGYGLATAMWQLMLASLAFNLLETAGTIVWSTMKQRRVPGELLGRVSSLDWLISIGLLPVSFALTAPLSRDARRAHDPDRRGPGRCGGDARWPAAPGHAGGRPLDGPRRASRRSDLTRLHVPVVSGRVRAPGGSALRPDALESRETRLVGQFSNPSPSLRAVLDNVSDSAEGSGPC